jgi:trehalose 6-phosphate phosphatase
VAINKGVAVRHLVRKAEPLVALYADDDVTDLDAFDALAELVTVGTLDDAVRVGVRS